MANAAKAELPLKQDKTAAVLAELRRPTQDKELKTLPRASADRPSDQTSGISAFSQAPVSELLVGLAISASAKLAWTLLTWSGAKHSDFQIHYVHPAITAD